jgi:hypothetical protein
MHTATGHRPSTIARGALSDVERRDTEAPTFAGGFGGQADIGLSAVAEGEGGCLGGP